MRAKVACGVWLALVGAVASAQVSKPGMGTVTGHVICQDTQRPARFGQVMLFAVPEAVAPLPKLDATDSKSIQAYVKLQTDAMNSANFVLSETGFDGSFVMDDVAPGDYYVMASVAGYVQPEDLVQAAYDEGADLAKGIPGVPIVRVSADRPVNAEVSVIRGAAVEGHVLWDDGAAVSTAMVVVEPTKGEHKQLPPQFMMMQLGSQSNRSTDDHGHYRISGLAPGSYIVRAMLQTNRRLVMQRGQFRANSQFGSMPLMVYAPAGFRKTDAKPVTLAAGEEHVDEDITFNLNATHTVSGRVTSAEDHHGLNRGVVRLTDAGDKTFVRSSGLDEDGNFMVTFVPSGTYTMEVMNAADTVPVMEDTKPGTGVVQAVANMKAVRSYQRAERQLIVAGEDLSGQNIEVTPMKTSSANDAANGSD